MGATQLKYLTHLQRSTTGTQLFLGAPGGVLINPCQTMDWWKVPSAAIFLKFLNISSQREGVILQSTQGALLSITC